MSSPDLTVETAESETLSQRVRERSGAAHREAEQSTFMVALAEGRVPREAYAEMLAQLGLVYEVIESAADVMRDDPDAGPFVFDELARGAAFVEDVDFLLDRPDRPPAAPTPATKQYLDRLREVCFTWPAGFVAHHYTRYMGDLSGGQFIRLAVARAYDLQDGRGVNSLTFDHIENRKAFRDEYRSRLDAMQLSEQDSARMIEEVLLAFRLNAAVIAEMDEVFGPEVRA